MQSVTWTKETPTPKQQKSPRLTQAATKLLLKTSLQHKVPVCQVRMLVGKSMNGRITWAEQDLWRDSRPALCLQQPSTACVAPGQTWVLAMCKGGHYTAFVDSLFWCLAASLLKKQNPKPYLMFFPCVATSLLFLVLITVYFSVESVLVFLVSPAGNCKQH